jgi:Ni,Fe-hydrogenase III large subunit/Ni,Fe-hydrogenase III component G
VTLPDLLAQANSRWPGKIRVCRETSLRMCDCEIECSVETIPELCGWLHAQMGYGFASLIAEERESQWELRYVWYGNSNEGILHVLVRQGLAERSFPTLIGHVHAVDWNEREVEDLFGIAFKDHPRLGDFVLHDDRWNRDVTPMRKHITATAPLVRLLEEREWKPLFVLEAPGAFAMPIGPIYSGVAESALFLLETQGEDVARCVPRLFYKYRGIEKIAEGQPVDRALLLAERCNGTSAFAHGLAFCQAAESIGALQVPLRAKLLRVLLAELERFRHHTGAIREICESTGLVVGTSQAAILEEELLALSCVFTGHRYLFGLNALGGLTRDFEQIECLNLIADSRDILRRLKQLEEMLRFSNSFLDRIEEVGVVPQNDAKEFGLVGPIARASGVSRDLRKLQPYSGYEHCLFDVPFETEGDGYARLRILFTEADQSVRIMEQAVGLLPEGSVCAGPANPSPGAALGWTEAPRGAAFHWLRVGDDGAVVRYHLATPSFLNWNGFHLAAENFAFQDFPIIMATFGLSVAENDR